MLRFYLVHHFMGADVQSMTSQSLRLSPLTQTLRLMNCSQGTSSSKSHFSLLYIFSAHGSSLVFKLASCLENMKIAPWRDRLRWKKKRAIIMSTFYLLEKVCYDGSKWGLLICKPPLKRSWPVFWTQARCVSPVLSKVASTVKGFLVWLCLDF